MADLKKKIIKDTQLLAMRDFLRRALQIPVTIVSANVLGAENFGLLKILNFVPSLGKFGNIGLGSVMVREVSKIKQDETGLLKSFSRNIAFSVTLLWVVLLSTFVFLSSLFFSRPEIKWGLMIVSITLMLNQIVVLFKVNCKLMKNFKLLSFADAVSSIISAIFILTTIYWLGIYSGLIASLIAAVTGCIILKIKLGLRFNFQFDRIELYRQLKIGIPMALTTTFFGIWLWTERILITKLWGLEGVGVYMLGVTAMQMLTFMIDNSLQAIGVHLYERLGEKEGKANIGKLIYSPTLTFTTISSIVGGGIIIFGPILIKILVPEYLKLIPLLPWMALSLFFTSISNMYATSMNSTHLNQQVRIIFFRLVSILLFVFSTYFLWMYMGGLSAGMIGRAFAMGILSILSIISTKKLLYDDSKSLFYELIDYCIPFIWIMFCTSFISLNVINSIYDFILNIVLFLIVCVPIIIRWEKKVGFIRIYYSKT